jgi:hypothetical protein
MAEKKMTGKRKEIKRILIDDLPLPENIANGKTAEEKELANRIKKIEEYREHLIKAMEGNTDRFEKQLSYISAGSLGISMAFIKDIVGSLNATVQTGLLISGWIAMGITLITNLISQVYANHCHSETVSEIDNECYEGQLANKRWEKIQYMNYFSITTLVLGISLLLLFIYKNI